MLTHVIKYVPLFSIMELTVVDAEVIIEIYLFLVFSTVSLVGVFIIGSISFSSFLNKFTDLYSVDGQLCLWSVPTSNGGGKH